MPYRISIVVPYGESFDHIEHSGGISTLKLTSSYIRHVTSVRFVMQGEIFFGLVLQVHVLQLRGSSKA